MTVLLPRSLRSAAAPALLVVLSLALAVPQRAGAAADDAERTQIAEERVAIESRYAARERECRDRFVVTSCIDDAKVERRRGLDALRSRQLRLDEARRAARTAERRAELAAKAADDARREQDRAARAASAPARPGASGSLEPRRESGDPASDAAAPRVPRVRPAPSGKGPRSKASPGESAEQRRARETTSRAAFDTRQREAAEHRRRVLDKAEQRLKSRPPAAPLPVPASVPAR